VGLDKCAVNAAGVIQMYLLGTAFAGTLNVPFSMRSGILTKKISVADTAKKTTSASELGNMAGVTLSTIRFLSITGETALWEQRNGSLRSNIAKPWIDCIGTTGRWFANSPVLPR
jgi:hypothetical protein